MALYRLHRMKENPRQTFRWAPHSSGITMAKPRDYEPAGEFEAQSAYALWQSLRLTNQALQLGDILELPGGGLRIFKYVGFEEAQWIVVEPKPGSMPDPASADATQPALPPGL